MRYQVAEQPWVLGKFDSGDTVTIALYDLADSSTPTLTSNACSEIGSTGVFKWRTSSLQSQPTSKTEYLWIMSNGTASSYGKVVLGGYPEYVDGAISDLPSASAIADAVLDEPVDGHTGWLTKLLSVVKFLGLK